MNEETFNMSIRKLLKAFGIRSQLEIEKAVQKALAEKRISGGESFPAQVQLRIAELDIDFKLDGDIKLQ
ncbi:MAG TPA: DUF6494 family protein [Burkholderiales bacterium]|nr:DUF6494 family protein [Burkholderiales bacterium]